MKEIGRMRASVLALGLLASLQSPSMGNEIGRPTGRLGPQAAASVHVLFFVPTLPSQGHKRGDPVHEWSYLDDTDSLFVVLRGRVDSASVTTTFSGFVEVVPSDSGEESSGAGPSRGRWVTYLTRSTKGATTDTAFGGVLLGMLHPTKIVADPKFGLKQGELVTRLRVRVRVGGGGTSVATIKLLQGL